MNIFVPHASDFLTNHRADGDGLVAFEVVVRLAERGHRVHVAAPQISVVGAIPPTLFLYELRAPGRLERLRYLVSVRALFERLRRRERFDVIHQLNPVNTGVSLALAGARLPLVLGSFVGDWPETPGARPRLRDAVARAAKRGIAAVQQRFADRLLVTTPAAQASRIVGRATDPAKIVILPHGIDPALYDGASGEPAQPAILYLGGIEHRKGILVMVDAFERLALDDPHVRLLIAGDGHLNRVLKARIEESPVRDRIRWAGRVPRERVPEMLKETAIYCLPSIGEPFGMSLLEAMAAAKPVVVTNAGGPAYITDELGALRVPPGDPVALGDALLDLLRSPERRRTMGAHNRLVVEERFAWNTVIGKLESVYRDVVATPS